MDGFVDDPQADNYDNWGKAPSRQTSHVFYSCDNYDALPYKRGDFSLGLSEAEQFRARKAQREAPS